MSKKSHRLNEIIKLLQIYNAISVNELAEKLGVSHMTVRRDLQELEQQDYIQLLHGGAVLNPRTGLSSSGELDYTLSSAESKRAKEKSAIGRYAASMIEPNDVVIIDAGSTTDFIAKAVPPDLPITVICYTFNVLAELQQKKNCKLLLTGGYLHENSMMFESPEGVSLIRRSRAMKAFVSASGISAELGVTCSNQYELETKKAIIDSSISSILVADSSKLGKVGSTYFADLTDFDTFITDSAISEEYKKLMHDLGIALYTV